MTIEEIRNYCLTLKGTTESMKWEDHLCFSVGDKMYLVTAPDAHPVSSSIKASDENFDGLTTREGIIPAPYMARHKWIHIDSLDRFSSKEWKELIAEAYRLVLEKLPKKLQKELAQ